MIAIRGNQDQRARGERAGPVGGGQFAAAARDIEQGVIVDAPPGQREVDPGGEIVDVAEVRRQGGERLVVPIGNRASGASAQGASGPGRVESRGTSDPNWIFAKPCQQLTTLSTRA